MNNLSKDLNNGILLLMIWIFFTSCNTNISKVKTELIPPSEFFPKEKAKVLVVGTFHFDYPNLDEIKIEDEDKIDVLKEPKKSELTELVEYIKKFNPNKIAVEAGESWNPTEKLHKYKNGEFRNESNEIFQLGMRIATEMDIDTIFGVDEWSYLEELQDTDSAFVAELTKDFDFKSDDPYRKYALEWLEHDKKVAPSVDLLTYIKNMNTKEYHDHSYGDYLAGDFRSDDHIGPDIISMWWYNRNIRIFRNIQRITENKNDRILVIIGNGHAAVLRHLFEVSPEYEFVEFGSL